MPRPRPLTNLAQAAVAAVLRHGDLAIDATLGNGHDALFLARAVGAAGRVIGFDIQPAALNATRDRLAAAGLADRVELHQAGHEHLADYLCGRPAPTAVMFNLGYLPGADKSCITRPETTRQALSAAWAALRPGGIISTLVYVGHPGGTTELAAVQDWLDTRNDPALSYTSAQIPAARSSPVLILLRRGAPPPDAD